MSKKELKLLATFLGEPIKAKDIEPSDNEDAEDVEVELAESDEDDELI